MNVYKTLIVAGVMAFAVSVAAAEYTVSWQMGETPATVADGKVSLAYEDEAITAMYADEPVDRLVFTGGSMMFAPAARIQYPADTLVFSNVVQVMRSGGVTFTKPLNDLVYGSLETGVPTPEQKAFMIPTASPVLVFPGYGLDEIELVCGSMQGAAIGNAKEARPFNPKPAEDGSIVVQMQAIDGTYLKYVRIRLFESDEGVWAQAVDAGYGYSDNAQAGTHQYTFGDDFDVYPGTGNSVCEPPGYGGAYGVKGLKARILSERPFEVEIAAPFTVSGEVQAENAVLKVSGSGSIGPDDFESAPAMTLNRAGVEWSDMRNSTLTLAGAISGTESELVFAQPHPAVDVIEEVVVDQAVQKTAVKIASGVSLDDIAGFKDANLYQNGALVGAVVPCFFERLEGRVRCQFQSDGDSTWNKCAMMEFTESDGNLYVRTEMSYWQYKNVAPAGEYDYRVEPYWGSNDYNYYPKKFTVVLKAPIHKVRRFIVNANAQNGLLNSTIKVGTNVTFLVNHQDALPNIRLGGKTVNAKTEVQNGGILNLNIAGPNLDNGLNACNGITVHRGGTLIQSFANAFARGQEIVVGGKVELMAKAGTGECGCYLNNLVFRDGGRLAIGGPRVGFYNSRWRVLGTGAACTNETMVSLVHYPTAVRPGTVWTLEVEDLTGDDEADFVFRGKFIDHPNEGSNRYYGLVRRKTGAGTLLLSEDFVSTAITGRWEIVEGTVAVAGSDQLSAERGYSLALQGGTLELKDGTENSFAFFTDLTATSGITLGANARLELPGAPQNWADDAIWQVTLGKKAKLRVGTDASSLSPEQLKRIRVNGRLAHLDANGYLYANGFLIIIR